MMKRTILLVLMLLTATGGTKPRYPRRKNELIALCSL
jgi:hypothetical protein